MMKPCYAVVPVSEKWGKPELILRPLGGCSALERTIRSLTSCDEDISVAVTTDSLAVSDFVLTSFPDVRLVKRTESDYVNAVREALEQMACRSADVVIAEATHPFRPDTLFPRLLQNKRKRPDLDSIICVRPLGSRLWGNFDGGGVRPLDLPDIVDGKASEFYEEFIGLGSVMDSELIFKGQMRGSRVGFEVINNLWSAIDINTEEAARAAELLARALPY